MALAPSLRASGGLGACLVPALIVGDRGERRVSARSPQGCLISSLLSFRNRVFSHARDFLPSEPGGSPAGFGEGHLLWDHILWKSWSARKAGSSRWDGISWPRKDAAVSAAENLQTGPNHVAYSDEFAVASEARAWQVKRIWSFRGSD